MSLYGKCDVCDSYLVPVWFIEKETIKGIGTGRKRRACSHIMCPICGKNYNVDDTFDGDWYR